MGSVVFALVVLLTVFALPVYSQDCPVGDLGPVVDAEVDERCSEQSVGSVQIAAGLACYNGLAPGSLAEYTCNCPQYELEGSSARVCAGGAWNGFVPECLPQCDSIPNPPNGFNTFVGPVDCSADSPNVTVTYSCGPYRNNRMIQFDTPTDGDCQWPDPPCRVRIMSLTTTGAGFYGSIMFNIIIMAIGFLVCYKLPNKGFIPIVVVVSVILPPVGLFLAWWLVRDQVPAATTIEGHQSFTRKWWRVILVIVGFILWLVCFVIYIALAAILAPQDAFPMQADYNLLIAGFTFMSITMIYWIVAVNFLCRCRRSSAATADGAGCSRSCNVKSGGEGPEDIPMGPDTLDESGKDSLWKP